MIKNDIKFQYYIIITAIRYIVLFLNILHRLINVIAVIHIQFSANYFFLCSIHNANEHFHMEYFFDKERILISTQL